MPTVLVAVDGSPAARPVLETGSAVARMAGAHARAVHVREHGSPGPRALARRLGVPLDVVEGPVASRLLAALGATDVVLGVVGARATPGGARPVGGTALQLLEHSATPLVIVPPDARPTDGVVHRILVPLEGSSPSSATVIDALLPLLAQPIDLVVLHVVGPRPPLVLDHARWDMDLWKDEFLARHCPPAARLRVTTGAVGAGVRRVARREDVDLVALTWGQDVAPDRAAVVRDVLSHTRVPVLLLPEART